VPPRRPLPQYPLPLSHPGASDRFLGHFGGRSPANPQPLRPQRVAAGTFGSWLGSTLSYWVSRWLGRVIVVNYGKYFLVTEAKLAMAERWVHRYEAGGIFFARLLPVIRHLISIPAGLVQMRFGLFSLMTILGAAANRERSRVRRCYLRKGRLEVPASLIG
jgi:hypothetical protein